jgi:hypothetical protein
VGRWAFGVNTSEDLTENAPFSPPLLEVRTHEEHAWLRWAVRRAGEHGNSPRSQELALEFERRLSEP